MKKEFFQVCIALVLLIGLCPPGYAEQYLSLKQAITSSLQTDEWYARSNQLEQAAFGEARKAASLPDPMVSLSMANLPADSWQTDQENMTQMKVGLTQRFPRGRTRSLKKEQATLKAGLQPLLRQDRQAKTRLEVATHWLNSYRAAKSIELIEQRRYLFEQLVEITTARYRSAVGKARQQDVIQAQLELSKLEDRLTKLRMAYSRHWGMLSEWIDEKLYDREILLKLPETAMNIQRRLESANDLVNHPLLRAMQTSIEVQHKGIDIAEQSYRPGWALNASYAYREDAPSGMERSDLVSVGVTFDLPLFTKNRQDQDVTIASSHARAAEIDFRLTVKNMYARYQDAVAQQQYLQQRLQLFHSSLLPQAKDQAEASLSAFTNDDGDFADVVRSYITELNTRIEAMDVRVRLMQAQQEMRYLTAQYQTDQPSGSSSETVDFLPNPGEYK